MFSFLDKFSSPVKAMLILTFFGIIGSALVAVSYTVTKAQIAANERAVLTHHLAVLVPDNLHDNDLLSDSLQVTDAQALGIAEPVTVYRARYQGLPVAIILNVVAPDGYSGKIYLLVAIAYDGTLLGVRVVSHQETPGLGDGIEERHSNWILSFAGKSLINPLENDWKVKRDGGVFDQFSGATITPRAVVKAVHHALQYYWEQRERLFL
ncbi:electron transport complex subunit RsxG [Beggiatoa leptomitoformis]|uniref:Ion-translocating oxidoreductase complex subunit G n=1 Tax=Beggiatoa leptomitoformis TaxID=288004 RepID=A0A2N9YCG9_9GAMM|nr:electron transport complex subunit RsxG [Beggiatoa leptomitoformis]ALG66542.1 electron transport complex subunit RsxG [Beggiatoa leptomitoformis]AUI68160.1 electron transport complex subunit RsxG [Beggiatoa leptomitoformis]